MARFETFVGKALLMPTEALESAMGYVQVFCLEHPELYIFSVSHDIVRLGNDMFVATVVVLFTDYQR